MSTLGEGEVDEYSVDSDDKYYNYLKYEPKAPENWDDVSDWEVRIPKQQKYSSRQKRALKLRNTTALKDEYDQYLKQELPNSRGHQYLYYQKRSVLSMRHLCNFYSFKKSSERTKIDINSPLLIQQDMDDESPYVPDWDQVTDWNAPSPQQPSYSPGQETLLKKRDNASLSKFDQIAYYDCLIEPVPELDYKKCPFLIIRSVAS